MVTFFDEEYPVSPAYAEFMPPSVRCGLLGVPAGGIDA
jgi:hypothetical protein